MHLVWAIKYIYHVQIELLCLLQNLKAANLPEMRASVLASAVLSAVAAECYRHVIVRLLFCFVL